MRLALILVALLALSAVSERAAALTPGEAADAAVVAVSHMYEHATKNDGTGAPGRPPGFDAWTAASARAPAEVGAQLGPCVALLQRVWDLAGEAVRLHQQARQVSGDLSTQLHQQGNERAAEASAVRARAHICLNGAVLAINRAAFAETPRPEPDTVDLMREMRDTMRWFPGAQMFLLPLEIVIKFLEQLRKLGGNIHSQAELSTVIGTLGALLRGE